MAINEKIYLAYTPQAKDKGPDHESSQLIATSNNLKLLVSEVDKDAAAIFSAEMTPDRKIINKTFEGMINE
jgi:hypothetical protein